MLLCSGLLAYESWSGAFTLRSRCGPQKLCPPASTCSRFNTVSTVGLGTSDGQVSRRQTWRTEENVPWQNWTRKRLRPLPTFIEPLVTVINHLQRILSQSSLHITETMLSSYLPKWTTFLHDKTHCLHPQWPSKTYILHGSLTNVELPVWIHIY